MQGRMLIQEEVLTEYVPYDVEPLKRRGTGDDLPDVSVIYR